MLWLSLACPAWAQEAEGEDSLLAKLQAWVETMQDYFRTRSPRTLIGVGTLVVGVCILFWIVRRLRRGHGGLASDPGRLKMEAQRLLRIGATLDAGLRFQQAGDLSAAADAYERGRSYVKAARLYEQARQAGHATRLYAWNRCRRSLARIRAPARLPGSVISPVVSGKLHLGLRRF